MAFNYEELKNKFQGLSIRYGGSLLQEKQLLEQDEVAVFIGLGGLGGRTVNAIKAVTNEKLKYPDRRFFLAVDTCTKDMDNISAALKEDVKGNDNANNRMRGCVEEEEKLPLFKEKFKIKTLSHEVDSWLNRAELGEVEVDDKGAQGLRQIGRVMLIANGNYDIVYNKLSKVLVRARDAAVNNNVEMKIYIIAGISGGTGSGTIVDFTYMVKRAISGFAPQYKKIDAIIFTPDVQFNDSGIDANKQKGLKVNFYAAIKEIDFFFNNKARKVSYKCPCTADDEVYKEDIFDFCTLISRRAQGIDVAANSDGVIKKVADALTFEISGINGVTTGNNSNQSYTAFFSNAYNNFQLWWGANSGENGLKMPDWAPSRYSSFAYSSFYIPRDELIAYCASKLMERLADQWKKRGITAEELNEIFRRNNIGSNKSFAGKLFEISNGNEVFDVEKSELPVDGFGPLKVKNCASYLGLMRSIAEQEGTTQRAKHYLRIAAQKQDAVFVEPIISLVDKAFLDENRGPVYAIDLLSAGIGREYNERSGILAWLNQLIDNLPDDVKTWELELEQVYAQLKIKAEKYDDQLSIDASDLDAFTNECREYGENYFKFKLLSNAKKYLTEIYNKLNDKNNRVFEIYTYAFKYLVDSLEKDAGYVVDAKRHREGQTTTFSFDLTDFADNDRNSKRFKQYFDSLVADKTLDVESKVFVSMVFGQLKAKFDPAAQEEKPKEVDPQEVIDIIRNYFKHSFNTLIINVIEQFCVVAYSNVDATADRIAAVWNNPELKMTAIAEAAQAIESKILSERKIMLNCADVSRDLQNFSSYAAYAALQDTPNINGLLSSTFVLGANWSEYIGYKRIFGFPLSLLADMDDFKKEYDAQAGTAGIHLDEMFDLKDGFRDWRYSLPEPYSYPTAKFLNKYVEDGKDTAETDRLHMRELLELATRAKALGLLDERTNDNAAANDENKTNAGSGQTFYCLISKLMREINIDDEKANAYSNIRGVVEAFKKEERELDFFEVLNRAGYKPGESTPIQWTFSRPELNVMKNRTDMGDDVNFGNFIILLRSNPYWEVQLKRGVELFEKLHKIYSTVCDEYAATDKFGERIKSFMDAIRVGRVVPFDDDQNIFSGFRIRVSDNSRDDITFLNGGLDVFDQKFLVYHCFTEKYVNLDVHTYNEINTIVEHDLSNEMRVNYTDEALANVSWFIDQCDTVLSDKEYLANFSPEKMKSNFRGKFGYSKFAYTLPTPSRNREDVEAVIGNLKSFYEEIKTRLSENLENDGRVLANRAAAPEPVVNNQAANAWACSCGVKNTGKFCQDCGKQRPANDGSWTCTCGTMNTGNFCQGCGKQRPANDGSWTCTCGTTNTGRFCQNCGKGR